jgi:hypothetical protein
VKRFKVQLTDRRSRQRGSILSAILIIVAFLSILVGALMTELTNSFLISQTLVDRQQREATVTSAVELGVHQLQTSSVPMVCARDARGPWFLNLNGSSAAVTETCTAIVPDLTSGLAPGAFSVNGVHDTTFGRDQYLVGDSAGRLNAYGFGQTSPAWSISTAGGLTGSPLPMVDDDGAPLLLVPSAIAGSSCGGHCVASFRNGGAAPSFHCSMPASTTVTSSPAAETTATSSKNFPDYVFFGGAGAGGELYVYDGASDHTCGQLTSAALGGGAVGAPVVFPGTKPSSSTKNDEVFVLVSDGSRTALQHWRYTESVDSSGNVTATLTVVGVLTLTAQVGGSASGYAISSLVPLVGSSILLPVAGSTGGLALVRITVGNGPAYSMSLVGAVALPGAVSQAPHWCQCPGQNLIGVGSTNGSLYLLNTSLAVLWTYDGAADGRPAINSSPTADAAGEWYFGADDGYVYDVEIPASGQQMFKAARFGPGGAIRSSAIVGGPADGCASTVCVYFASTTSGAFFAQIGTVRIIDLRACISTGAGSTSCMANPRLWARVEVGPAAFVGGSGVYVQGWSYYSP